MTLLKPEETTVYELQGFDELLECPFCGNTPYISYQSIRGGFRAVCASCTCGMEIPSKTIQEAIALWNTRDKRNEFLPGSKDSHLVMCAGESVNIPDENLQQVAT